MYDVLQLLILQMITQVSTPEVNPYRWDEDQVKTATSIVEYSVKNGEDPYELLAVSWVESRFDDRAVSHTCDFGMMQVNCRVWYDELGYDDIAECIINMFDPSKNMNASSYILDDYRNHRGCKGTNLYACYNGGPGWRASENRDRIERYMRAVLSSKWIMKHRYGTWVRQIVEQVNQSVCIYPSNGRECNSFRELVSTAQ